MNKSAVSLLGTALAFSFFYLVIGQPIYYWNRTESVPIGIYMRFPGKIKMGDYVVFRYNNQWFIKQVLGIKWYRTNDIIRKQEISPRMQKTALPAIIPPGYVYIGSYHPKGYDSRYFGLVEQKNIRKVIRWSF